MTTDTMPPDAPAVAVPRAAFLALIASPDGRSLWIKYASNRGIPVDGGDAVPDDVVLDFMPKATAYLAERADVIDDLPGELRRSAHPLEVQDAGKAAWVISTLRGKQAEIARVEAEAAAMVKAMRDDAERFERAFVPNLRAWAEANKERKKQFALTPAGKLSFSAKGADVVLDGPDGRAALLAWAQENRPELVTNQVTTKTDVDFATIKAELKAKIAPNDDGELTVVGLPPGLVVTPPGENFKIDGVKLQ